jgi:hypothetical protein
MYTFDDKVQEYFIGSTWYECLMAHKYIYQ